MSPVVFEYRCPNSTPSILWDSSGPSWKALFPNRSIPAELHDCFHGVDKSVRHAEELWKSAQYRLALKLLDDQEAKGRSPDYQNLLTLLGMLARGVSHSRGVPVLFTLGHLAAICGVSFVFLHDIVSRRTDEYRVFFIRKKSGGHRRITVPLPSLLIVQSWLQEHILSHQPVHACSQAFSEGCSPAKNAQQHCSSKWLVKIDVENFFESITERHVFRVFKQIGFRPLLSFELARICTRVIDHSIKSRAYLSPRMVSYRIADYRCAFQGHLPQGAPTSPALANLACYNLDEDLNDIAGKYKCVYTRYADDIVFSTQEFSRQTANRLLKDATSSLKRFGLKPNRKKMTIVPPGARRIVTGLVVDGSVPRLSKEYRERIELHLYHAAKHGLAEHCKRREFRSLIGFRNHLHGLITYAEHIEPRFGARCRSEFESLPWGALLDFFS
jgi:RNA-directed DNA polymerase